ncbi:hypothetical protein L484_007010 [Morus notabilis]|uniref:Uncharacterized protein n=1 Tax=Morus notabilis TaxID=981085 RepID=W9RW07_9ROSA|nr:hypothetical protein L484_007010 [Morus notabilis]
MFCAASATFSFFNGLSCLQYFCLYIAYGPYGGAACCLGIGPNSGLLEKGALHIQVKKLGFYTASKKIGLFRHLARKLVALGLKKSTN